jgi:hypothetical protein
MTRPRQKPRLRDIAASALADKLPQAERDQLRADKVPAEQIIRMFTADHIVLHTWGGPAAWWNYDMRRRGPELKAKDNTDTSRAAKAVRIDRVNADRQRILLAKTGEHRDESAKPKRRVPKRVNPWPPRGSRKLRSRGFQRRHA